MIIKRALWGSIVLFIILSFILTKSHAQAPSEDGIKSEAIELFTEAIYEPCENPSNELCAPYPTGINHPDPNNTDHEFGLIGEDLPLNAEIYIVGCINTDQGARCTTGNQTLDAYLNSFAGGDQMNKDPSHDFKALTNPVNSNNADTIEVIVRSYSPQSTIHFFKGYYIEPLNNPTTSTSQSTSYDGMKLSDFNFEDSTEPSLAPSEDIPNQPRAPKKEKKDNICENPCWPVRCKPRGVCNDPKGRLFDTKSLEPIPEGEMTLLDNVKKQFVLPGLPNPQKVKMNAEFNFWVPNGIYYLDVSKKPVNYSWPVSLSLVHPHYQKAYFCDPEVTNQMREPVPLYTDQYQILEYDKLVHCDIPLDPGASAPYKSEVKTMSFSLSRTVNSYVYNGRVTHPLTAISLKGETTGKEVATITTDKLGFWETTVALSDYPLTTNRIPDKIVVYYTKTDLTEVEQNTPVVGHVFEPLLRSVEGYAYDASGAIMRKAIVGYQQQATDNIVFITTSDNNGYFKIPTRYLPSFSYTLVFMPAGSSKTISYTTSKFVSQNAGYLKEKNINLLTNINKELLRAKPPSVKNYTTESQKEDQRKTNGEGTRKQSKTRPSLIYIIGLVILIIVIIIGFVLVFNKQRAQPPQST